MGIQWITLQVHPTNHQEIKKDYQFESNPRAGLTVKLEFGLTLSAMGYLSDHYENHIE